MSKLQQVAMGWERICKMEDMSCPGGPVASKLVQPEGSSWKLRDYGTWCSGRSLLDHKYL